jgi:hypothetical protein
MSQDANSSTIEKSQVSSTLDSSRLSSGSKNIIASALATIIAEFATAPICTLKTNFQNSNNQKLTTVFWNIYSNHGMIGFYRASFAAIGSQVLSTSSKFFWYSYLNERYPAQESDLINRKFIIGSVAGLLSSFMTHPVDVLKIYFQMNTFRTKFFSDLREVGPLLFYRGYSKTMSKSVFSSFFFYPLLDILRDDYQCSTFVASGISALISTTLMQPLDYMKVRNIYGLPYFNGFNPLNYFKGISLNFIRIVPHFTITMTGIEYIKSML